MAGRQHARSGAGVFDNIEDWMKQRHADVRRLGHEAELAGREAWDQATRTGQKLAATRPSDVVALGARVLAQPKPQPNRQAGPPTSRPAPAQRSSMPARPSRSLVQQGVDEALAGARGAQDAFSFGLGDRAYAGGRALVDAAQGADLGDAWRERMATERARDQYDAQRYGVARTVGQVVGTGAQIAALGPAEALFAGGTRIAQATPLIAREVAALGGAGGVAGVGGQVISDLSQGRVGSLGDYGGAAVGGVVGALAARSGRAGHAGAAMGATTSLAQDAFNGNLSADSIDKTRSAALAGGVFGTVGGMAGRRWSDGLSRKEKELLGEDFSRLRTRAAGDTTVVEKKKAAEVLRDGGRTIPDQRTLRNGLPHEIVESKFGRFARLSKRQKQAYEQPLPNYRVDHALPRDVGVVVGLPAAGYGSQSSRSDQPW